MLNRGRSHCPDDNDSKEFTLNIAQDLIINFPIRTKILDKTLFKLEAGPMTEALGAD
jgi:hypothetical protein